MKQDNRSKRLHILVFILIAGILCLSFGTKALAQNEHHINTINWGSSVHIHSEVATRWTSILIDDFAQLHSFWAVAEPDDTRGPYSSEYHTLMYATSQNGSDWSWPTDILYDRHRINMFEVLKTEQYYHLFWNSECVKQAKNSSTSNLNDPRIWMNSARCIAPPAIAEGLAVTGAQEESIYLLYSVGDTLYFQASTNQGDTWSDPSIITTIRDLDANVSIITYPQIAVSQKTEQINVVWGSSTSAEDSFRITGIYYANSIDQGQTWSQPTKIANAFNTQPDIVVDHENYIHIIWNTTVDLSKRLHRWSADNGNTWSTVHDVLSREITGVPGGLQGAPSITVTEEGTLYALLGTNAGIRLRQWHDGTWHGLEDLGTTGEGETWSTGITADPGYLCIHWSGYQSQSRGFSILCEQTQIIKPSERNISTVQSATVTPEAYSLVSEYPVTVSEQADSQIHPSFSTEPPHPHNNFLGIRDSFLVGSLYSFLLIIILLLGYKLKNNRF